MSVSNGQRANETTFNDALMSRTDNTSTVGTVGLLHPSSGGTISNAQQQINDNKDNITSNDTDIATLTLSKQDIIEKGAANGYAPLDGSSKIDPVYLPTEVVAIKGNWNASTNTPTLADGVGDAGDTYIVNVAGTQDLGSGNITFDLGDWAFYTTDNVWIKVLNSNSVTSVNGQTGVVSLGADDITDIDTTTVAPVIGQALVWDGSDWVPGEAGGSGQGGINYAENPDAEIDASDQTAYKDAAQDTPVDGTGGSPTLSVTRTTISGDILRGTASFAISKPSSNVQGEGIHLGTRAIDPRDTGDRLQWSFDYKHTNPGSNNYADGDLRAFVYDVDNATLIGALENDDGGDLLRHTGDGATFVGFFTATDSLNYRLLLHQTTTDATSAATIYDNVKLGPIEANLFSNITDMKVDANPDSLWNGTIGNGTINVSYRRVGDSMEIEWNIILGSTTTFPGEIRLLIPENKVLDKNKSAEQNSGVNQVYGSSWAFDNGTAFHTGQVTSGSSNYLIMFTNANGGTWNASNPFTWAVANNDQLSAKATIPIEGWSASNLVSNTELTQKTITTVCPRQLPTGTITGSFTNIVVFGITNVNDGDAYNTSTGQWTAPRDGRISVSSGLEILYSVAAGITSGVQVRNATTGEVIVGGDINESSATLGYPNCSGVLSVTRGDIVEVRSFCNGGSPVFSQSFTSNHFTINYLPDFSSYGVLNPKTEIVESSAVPVTPYTIAANTFGDLTSITLDEGEWDITLTGIVSSSGVTTASRFDIGVGTTAGNTTTGLLNAENFTLNNLNLTSVGDIHSAHVPRYTVVLTSTTTLYFKSRIAGSITNITLNSYKMSARRIK